MRCWQDVQGCGCGWASTGLLLWPQAVNDHTLLRTSFPLLASFPCRAPELFERKLAPFLSQTSIEFWKPRLWYFQQGLYYQGGMVRNRGGGMGCDALKRG